MDRKDVLIWNLVSALWDNAYAFGSCDEQLFVENLKGECGMTDEEVEKYAKDFIEVI